MSKKDRIIGSAARLFHRQGFRDTSVDQILEASNTSKSNFYYHFRSKEELGFDVLERWVEGFQLRVKENVLGDETVDPLTRIETFFSELIRPIENRGGRYGCPFGNMALELSDVHEGFRSRLSRFFDEWAGALETCLEQGKRDGVWSRELDSRGMAHFMIAVVEGAIMLTKVHRRSSVLHESMEMIMRLIKSYEN